MCFLARPVDKKAAGKCATIRTSLNHPKENGFEKFGTAVVGGIRKCSGCETETDLAAR